MHDLTRMCEVAMSEIDKIAEKGLTTTNLESVYKLVDIVKDIKTIEAMEDAGYSEEYDAESYARGRGRNAKRDSMGRYSRRGNSYDGYDDGMSERDMADMRYSQAKMDYRQSRAGKHDVMASLEEKMRELKKELKEMSKDSDFPEERQKIDKYVNMLDSVM